MFLREMENYIKHYEIIHLEEKYWQKRQVSRCGENLKPIKDAAIWTSRLLRHKTEY